MTEDRIKQIQKDYPELTKVTCGYENLDRKVLRTHAKVITELESLLKIYIEDFVKFQNFKPRRDGKIMVRCQTMWEEGFQGVSYIDLGITSDATKYYK